TTVPSSTFNSILSTVFASSIFSNVAAAEDEMIEVPGGTWLMGTSAADGRDGESPVRQVKVESFQMDKYPVTNEDFRSDLPVGQQVQRQKGQLVAGWFSSLMCSELVYSNTVLSSAGLWFL
uniref:Sulfatase modifying factor 2 n=1 Tax=Neogobius melanostomus TaxID=47308 RepID=A0A8C6TSC1_9GOBI